MKRDLSGITQYLILLIRVNEKEFIRAKKEGLDERILRLLIEKNLLTDILYFISDFENFKQAIRELKSYLGE